MSIFSILFNNAKVTAKNVTHKTGEMIEGAKLSFAVSTEEDKIEKTYASIGKKIYEEHCAGQSFDEDINSYCEEVDSEEAKIRLLNRTIAELKQTTICKSCNATVKKDALFCPKCGIRI
ncbi:MAG: zinc-ribbon domain-containing protein [Clostridia bacterium]